MIDAQLRSDVQWECNAMDLGSFVCSVRAAGTYRGVRQFGGGVIGESISDIDGG